MVLPISLFLTTSPFILKGLPKIALAFSDDSNQYDYLRRLYIELNKNDDISIQKLTSQGFTTREIEILTGIPKSSVARKLKDDIDE